MSSSEDLCHLPAHQLMRDVICWRHSSLLTAVCPTCAETASRRQSTSVLETSGKSPSVRRQAENVLHFPINLSEGRCTLCLFQPAPFSDLLHPQKLYFAFYWHAGKVQREGGRGWAQPKEEALGGYNYFWLSGIVNPILTGLVLTTPHGREASS